MVSTKAKIKQPRTEQETISKKAWNIFCTFVIGDRDCTRIIKILNILSPHIGTILCNGLTIKYFLLSKYWPVFVTVVENTCIHFLASVLTLLCLIKDDCCKKVTQENNNK